MLESSPSLRGSSVTASTLFIPKGQSSVLYSLAIQEVHEGPEHTICILSH